uniref:Uncharacterized protein LOC102802396 n=1 Tax=Saccoglossus kowalevskii TaxID=10224 RepID=A0ABM0MJG6_SACKO|nr:PREDICTED: uncharacterized protein LOC102802396 [Saccoglossus kowalevskii]
MIVIGSMYKDDCNAQPYIPIYLIVAGSCSLFSLATSVGGCRSKYRENDEEKQKKGTVGNCCGCISGLVSLFMMCWFITGSVWIYKAYEPSYEDPTASDYCDKTLYLFSFWMLNVGYMVVGLCCCAGLLGLCCKLKARNEQ